MEVIIISESLIVRKGIKEVLSKENYINRINESHSFCDIDRQKYDLIIIDINKNNEGYLLELKEIKENTKSKIMVLDFYKNTTLFSKCMKVGIDGYILANINSEDIVYAVKQLYKNKKYYDPDLIENYMVKENNEYIEELTKREYEILVCIAKGKTNSEISEELFITEYTVKKHTSNIFAKLNLKDRVQAALYAYSNGIITL